MNKQREVIYAFRNEIILAEPEKLRERVLDVINDLVMTQSEQFMASQKDAQPQELIDWAQASFPVAVREDEIASFAGNPEGAGELIYKRIESAYADKCGFEDPQVLPIMERQVVLRAIDTQWQEFLRAMDELRHGVGLRAYGQRDPLVEYKREAYGMFEELMGTIKTEIAQSVFKFTTSFEQYQRMMQNTAVRRQQTSHASLNALAASGASSGGSSVTTSVTNGSPAVNAQFERALSRALPEEQPSAPQQPVVNGPRVGRNDPCPCGSGKKYKKCCGRGL